MSEVTSSQNVNSSNNVTGGGVDYDSGPYTVTFSAGQMRVSFSIAVNDDGVFEADERFRLSINQALLPVRVTSGSPNQATVTISDNDGESLYTQFICCIINVDNCMLINVILSSMHE